MATPASSQSQFVEQVARVFQARLSDIKSHPPEAGQSKIGVQEINSQCGSQGVSARSNSSQVSQ